MQDLRKLSFIGGGNMASALIGGLIREGLSAQRIWVLDPELRQRERLTAQFSINAMPDEAPVVRDADVVVLAVKPQLMRVAAASLAPRLAGGGALLISVAAGITHDSLARWFAPGTPIVRAMPNRPALLGLGATGLYAPPDVGAAHRALTESIMTAVGATVWVERESQMDTVTAVSGSGPAYFFLFMEAIEAAARDRGLPPDVARRLTLQTALGAATMAQQSIDTLATLREQVTSKGGTTAAALAVLDAADLRGIVANAVAAADRRSAELAAQFGAP
jgi:pyrroline-5-carboxylate reductase